MIKVMRWTIAKKVGGTIFILLAVILSLLVHSIFALSEIETELKEIAGIDVPLSIYANEIEIAQLEQRILMDEIIRKHLINDKNITQEKEGILYWSKQINSQFELAINVSEQGVNITSSSEFSDILAILSVLKNKHQKIEILLAQLIDGNYSTSQLEQIILQDEQFDHLAIELIHAVEKLTMRKANVALKHEQQFAVITYSLAAIGALIGIALAVLVTLSIKASIANISDNINLVSSAIKSNKDIPVEQVERGKSSDEFSELSDDLADMIEQVSTDIDKREQASKALNEIATTDHLTKCFNRLKWDQSLNLEVEHCKKSNESLALIFFDIDHFKKINDSYGHDIGDVTLIEVVKITQENIRQQDTLYRTGGEEFSVLLPNTKLPDAQHLAQRINRAICEFTFPTVEHVTVSLGVTIFKGEGDTSSAFAKRADLALYQSKETGRNKVSTLV